MGSRLTAEIFILRNETICLKDGLQCSDVTFFLSTGPAERVN